MNKCILIIDDSPSLRRLIKYSVNRVYKNLEYLEASDGKEGLDILSSGARVDVIILDINMPRMDGLAFMEKRKGMEKVKDIPIIILSKKDENEIKPKAHEYGTIEYLPKPFNVSKMKEILKKILEDRNT